MQGNNMKIFKQIPISNGVDVPNKTAMIITFDCGCNLRCTGCHYFATRKQNETLNIDDGLKKIKKQLKSGVVEAIVLNGGEFLDYKAHEIYEILKELSQYEDIELIINTNGTNPEMVKELLKHNIHFHLDIKSVPENGYDLTKEIIGPYNPNAYFGYLEETLDLLYSNISPEHILRTVKYPQYTQKEFDNIKKYLTIFESKYKKKLSHTFNSYIEI